MVACVLLDMTAGSDWSALLKKLDKVSPPKQKRPSNEDKCPNRISESSVSDRSLGNVIRALFEESSLSSLESVKSTDDTQINAEKSDSVLECLYNLFGLDSNERILAKSRWSSVVPATPCNSRSNTPTASPATEHQPTESPASNLQGALKRLFTLESKDSAENSTTSLTNLGDAMRKMFYTDSMEKFGLAPKPSVFGTSNTSLEDAMKLLFDSGSNNTLDQLDSLENIPIWALFDSDSEETITQTDGSKGNSREMYNIAQLYTTAKLP